jgi:hypothetical protein
MLCFIMNWFGLKVELYEEFREMYIMNDMNNFVKS